AVPHRRRAAHQFLRLPGQRQNRKDNDRGGDCNERKNQQDHTDEARETMFSQPYYDRVQDHGQKENEREQQYDRFQRAHDQPENDQQKNHPYDAPGAVITQRRMLILVTGFFHEGSLLQKATKKTKSNPIT